LDNIIRNFSQQPTKESALDMLDRASVLRRGTIQMVQSSLQAAEARVATQRIPTTLSERFATRRIDTALQNSLPRLIEVLRRRADAIAKVVKVGLAKVECLAIVARSSRAKAKSEAGYWRDVHRSGKKSINTREPENAKRETQAKSSSR
jgi:hypothetical protein